MQQAPYGYPQYPPQPPPPKKGTSATVKILIVLGGVFVLSVGSCVLCVGLGAMRTTEPISREKKEPVEIVQHTIGLEIGEGDSRDLIATGWNTEGGGTLMLVAGRRIERLVAQSWQKRPSGAPADTQRVRVTSGQYAGSIVCVRLIYIQAAR